MNKKEVKDILRKYNELWKNFQNDDYESINNTLLTNLKEIDILDSNYGFKQDQMYINFYQSMFWSLYYEIKGLTH